jgi:hypothetical protein
MAVALLRRIVVVGLLMGSKVNLLLMSVVCQRPHFGQFNVFANDILIPDYLVL